MILKKVARKADPYLVLSICLCAVIGIGSFLYYIFADGGVFTLRDDFNSQQLPFSVALNHLLKNDLGEWSWNTDLGTQTVGAYSFYGLGSPFFWVSMLFPGSAFPYIVGYLYILKYVVAGATSYCYIKRFVKNPFYALIGALLYSFSGFQSTNLLFYHFHDAVAFFPLLLIGIEKALTENKKAWFIFAVFLNCMVNYFFFIGEVVFLLIYFVVRFWGRPSDMLKKAGICLFCGVLGVGMAAVLFIPSILFVLTNPRTNNSIHDILFSKKEILFIIKGILLPGEAMNNQSCVIDQHWNSTACYLPMTGISMVITYLLRKRDWVAKLLWISLVFSFVPILTAAFTAFTTVYQRWWYMPILFMAIATAIVLENHREYPVRKGILINLIMLLLFVAVVGLAPKILGMEVLIFRPKVFIYNVLIAVVGLGILLFIFLSFKIKKRILCMGISLFCFITTFSTIYLYRQDSVTGSEYMSDYYEPGAAVKNIDSQYRYNCTKNEWILFGNGIGAYSFNSTVSSSIFTFDRIFGYERNNFSLDVNTVPGLKELVGAKYRIVDHVADGQFVVERLECSSGDYYVIEEKACPIGFAYDAYITEEVILSLESSQRGIGALQGAIVSDKDAAELSETFDVLEAEDLSLAVQDIEGLVDGNIDNAVKKFFRDSRGFSCVSSFDSDKIVYFSVPYDEGWTAMVDGEETNIIQSAGMMAIGVSGGTHNIVFEYHTPGLKAGGIISLSCMSVYILYGIVAWKKRSNQKWQRN